MTPHTIVSEVFMRNGTYSLIFIGRVYNKLQAHKQRQNKKAYNFLPNQWENTGMKYRSSCNLAKPIKEYQNVPYTVTENRCLNATYMNQFIERKLICWVTCTHGFAIQKSLIEEMVIFWQDHTHTHTHIWLKRPDKEVCINFF